MYNYDDCEICKYVFWLIYDIGEKRLKNIVYYFKKNGFILRLYGNKGRKLNYVLKFDDIKKVVNFVVRYGEENGFLLFVVFYVNDFLEILILLFVLMIKIDIYLIYKIVCEESYGRVVELLIFKGIWLMCIFYIKIVLFRLDVCLKCEKF